jgi:hypothetical protein
MAGLMDILIEKHKKFNVDIKIKTAVCALHMQPGKEQARAIRDSMGLQFTGKVSKRKNNVRLRRVL